MALELAKAGQKLDLTKDNPTLNVLNVALGWDANPFDNGHEFDLDVTVFPLTSQEKVLEDRDVIYYKNLEHYTGSIVHSGDEKQGNNGKDDEVIRVDLRKLPSHVEKLAFVVTIHDAHVRGQNFGKVRNAFVRVDDAERGTQLIEFDLGEELSTETGVLFCEIYKYRGEWKFKAVGEGYNNGLAGFVKMYGLDVA